MERTRTSVVSMGSERIQVAQQGIPIQTADIMRDCII